MKQLVFAIIEAIGNEGAPSGHIYAALMSVLNLDQYNKILQALKDQKLVEGSGHFLTLTNDGKEILSKI